MTTVKDDKAFEKCLADNPENQQWRPIFMFMLYTGMRVGGSHWSYRKGYRKR